jgi:hypothetical protein
VYRMAYRTSLPLPRAARCSVEYAVGSSAADLDLSALSEGVES